MRDKEKIKMLEQQIELLEKVIELQRGMLVTQVITVAPIATREVYPIYPPVVPYYGTGEPLPAWPIITCQG